MNGWTDGRTGGRVGPKIDGRSKNRWAAQVRQVCRQDRADRCLRQGRQAGLVDRCARLELREHDLEVLLGGRLGKAREFALPALKRVDLTLDPRHVGVLCDLEADFALGGDAAAHRRWEQREKPRRAHAKLAGAAGPLAKPERASREAVQHNAAVLLTRGLLLRGVYVTAARAVQEVDELWLAITCRQQAGGCNVHA